MAKVDTTPKTKKPAIKSVVRSNGNFTASWGCSDTDYKAGQKVKYYNGSWTEKSINYKLRSYTFSLTRDNFYPNTGKPKLGKVVFQVKGERGKFSKTKGSGKKRKTTNYNPTPSDYAKGEFSFTKPPAPSINVVRDEELTNVSTFNFSVANLGAGDHYFASDIYYQFALLADSSVTNGENVPAKEWGSGATCGLSGSVVKEEEPELLYKEKAYTRWIRAKTRGINGDSDWAYAKHVYSSPYQATVLNATYEDNGANGYQCTVQYSAPKNVYKPIKKVTVEYGMGTPDEGMSCPDGITWNTGRISTSMTNITDEEQNYDEVSFPIDGVLGLDMCLFVRVNTQYDFETNVTTGTPALVTDGYGYLKSPTITSVDEDQSTFEVEIEATNNSEVEDSFLVVVYRPASDLDAENVVAVIPHGETTVQFQAPDWSGETSHAFGVYAAVGDPDTITRSTAIMMSKDIIWRGGEVPEAPENVSATATEITGTVRVRWDWTWTGATGAELSWSDHEDAWESTDEPDTYEISKIHAAQWNISGLETGMRWYVRVRLITGHGDNKTYSPWSEITPESTIDLTSAPSVPTLLLSNSVITESGSVTASWVYTTTDGTEQSYAEICEATITDDGIQYGRVIAHTQTAQHITINANDPDIGWETGNTYHLCVRVRSASGRVSDDWSTPKDVTIAEPLQIAIDDTSLVEETFTDVIDGQTFTRTALSLKDLPLTVEVSGLGESGTGNIIIDRAEPFQADRPDESEFDGYKGETIVNMEIVGDDEYEITSTNLLGSLDDTAQYNLVFVAQDTLGQKAETEPIKFEVHWSKQAVIPWGRVQYDEEDLIARLFPIAPEYAEVGNPVVADIGTYYELIDDEYVLTADVEIDDEKDYYVVADVDNTDTCDIYRLSVDRPQLIYEDAIFGEEYIDPYPAIGEFGGYRFVFKTANKDYVTDAGKMARLDIDDEYFETPYTIIDYANGKIMLQYNVDFASQWEKDFQETKYLGGSVQGDWNAAVSRKATINAVTITLTEADTISAIRLLADTPGICHVRTQNGSSFAADVQVSISTSHDKYGMIETASMTITRVDPEGLDGMTVTEWEQVND